MKQFFQFLFASCLGILLSVFIIFMFFMLMGIFSTPQKEIVKSNSILELNLSAPLPEQSNNVELSPFSAEKVDPVGLHKTLKLIEAAADDGKIKGIIIRNGAYAPGIVAAQMIRQSLLKFKESGKFVYTYGDYLTQGTYYLSSVSDSIFLNPNGMIDIRGFAINGMFYKKAADRLGIKLNTFYAGKYKGASEPYRRTDFSENNEYQLMEYLNDVTSIYYQEISDSRGISFDRFNEIVNNYESMNADSAVSLKLADALRFESGFEDLLKEKLGYDLDDELKLVGIDDYAKMATLPKGEKSTNKIAIIYAEGTINNGGDEKGTINVDRYQESFDDIRNNDDIKGVILRVNSGGGSAFESDVFLHELNRIKDKGKYIAVSMGDYAASGGYYIACAADTIVASPLTLTGSIGVVSMIPELSEFLEDKVGVTFDVVKTHKYADAMSTNQPMSEGLKAKYQQGTQEVYDKFIRHVAEARQMDVNAVDQVAQGRVWTGMDAKDVGLVDELGDLRATIDIVKNRLDLEKAQIMHFPKIEKDIYAELLSEIMKNTGVQQAKPDILNHIENSEFLNWYSKTAELADGQPKAIFPWIVEN